MFEALKKRALKSVLFSSIVFCVLGIAMIIFMGREAYYGITGYETFETLAPDEIRGQMVDVSLTLNFGAFLKESERNTDTNITTDRYYYYVILTGDETADDFRYMSIKVPASYHSDMDAMSENTFEGYYSEPMEFFGKIRKLSKEDYQYFKEYFTDGENGLTDEEFEACTIPYYIQVETSKTGNTVMGIIICASGLVLIILGIVRIWRAASGASLKKFRAILAEQGCTEMTAESDYNAARSYTKKGDLRIGRLFLYYMSGYKPMAIPNSKILWAYQTTTTHRTNGIKTGTTYSIMVYEDGRKGSIVLPVPNESTAHAMLDQINTTLPWVVVGYTDQLQKLFSKDRAQFLSLRYNTVEHLAVDSSDPYAQSTYSSTDDSTGNSNT